MLTPGRSPGSRAIARDAVVGELEDVGQRRVRQRVGRVIGTAPGMFATQ